MSVMILRGPLNHVINAVIHIIEAKGQFTSMSPFKIDLRISNDSFHRYKFFFNLIFDINLIGSSHIRIFTQDVSHKLFTAITLEYPSRIIF